MKLRRLSRWCLPLVLVSAAASVHAAPEVMPLSGTPGTGLETTVPVLLPPSGGNLVLPRWENHDVTGSLFRYWKYGVPVEGGALGSLQLQATRNGLPYLQLRLDNAGQPSSGMAARWDNPFPRAYAAASGDRYRFYLYPEAGGSVRQTWGLAAGTALADNKTLVGLRTRYIGQRVAKPGDDLDWSATRTILSATRPLGAGDVDVDVTLRGFNSRTVLQPNSHQARYRLGYTANLPGASSLGLNYARSEVNQAGARPAVDTLTLTAISPVGGSVVASARLGTRRVSNAVQQTGYTKSANDARLSLSYRGIRGLLMRAGYDRREFERVGRQQTTTADSEWNSVWGSISYRPTRRWQVVGKASQRANPNPPASGLTDPLPLLMNLDRSAEVRIQGAPMENTAVYLAANTRFRKNTRRNIEVQYDTTSVGGWVQVLPRLSLNADYSLVWGDSRNLAVMSLMSDSKVATLGGSLNVSPKLWLDSSYSNYKATGAQNISQDVWAIGARRQLAPGAIWSLDLRRDDYRDRVNDAQSYTANVVTVSGSTRF